MYLAFKSLFKLFSSIYNFIISPPKNKLQYSHCGNNKSTLYLITLISAVLLLLKGFVNH